MNQCTCAGLPQSALMLHQRICVEMSNMIMPEFLVEITVERVIQKRPVLVRLELASIMARSMLATENMG